MYMYVIIITCTAVVYFNEVFAMHHCISREKFREKDFYVTRFRILQHKVTKTVNPYKIK